VRELTRFPLARTLLLGLASFGLTVASLGIDQTAQSEREAQHLGFGYPLHFVFSDFSIYYTPPPGAQSYSLNPWEVPVQGNPLAFLISWVLVYGVLLGSWLLACNASGQRSGMSPERRRR
jgi:hypothetical protein